LARGAAPLAEWPIAHGRDRRYLKHQLKDLSILMDKQLRYTAVFEPAEEGGYIVTFPAIPGLATQGETVDEARAMAADCLRAYLESLRKDGEPLPYEAAEGLITERLTVDLAKV